MEIFSRRTMNGLLEEIPAGLRLSDRMSVREALAGTAHLVTEISKEGCTPVQSPKFVLLVGARGSGNQDALTRLKRNPSETNVATVSTSYLMPEIMFYVNNNARVAEEARVWIARTAVNQLSDGAGDRYNIAYPCNTDALTRRGLIENLADSGYDVSVQFYVVPFDQIVKNAGPHANINTIFDRHFATLGALQKAFERPDIQVSLYWEGRMVAETAANEAGIRVTSKHGMAELIEEVLSAQSPLKRDPQAAFQRLLQIRAEAVHGAIAAGVELTK